jgi:hypothetical protein
MALVQSVVGFVLSFAVVTAATYVSTAALAGSPDLGYSAVTALLTSFVWFGVTYLVSGVVGVSGYAVALGPVLAVLAYLLVVDFRYEGGVFRAAAISAGTWVATFLILYVAAQFGYGSLEAMGVPVGTWV